MVVWSPILLILNLAVGFAAIAIIVGKTNILSARAVRAFSVSLLLFNLHLASLTAARFLRLAGPPETIAAQIRAGVSLANSALGFGWVFSFLILLNALLGSGNSRRLYRIGGAFLAVLLVLTGAAWVRFAVGATDAFPGKPLAFIFGQRYLLSLAAALCFLWSTGREKEADRRRALTALGRAYSGLLLGDVLLIGIYLQFGWISSETYSRIGHLADFGYNLIPIWWIFFFGRALAPHPAALSGSAEARERQIAKYGITNREWEVIELICQGKTNQEIADRLFLSLKTIKDHNYSIFQKTGVKNRVQLVNLFSKGSS